jgi:hypothetical protein
VTTYKRASAREKKNNAKRKRNNAKRKRNILYLAGDVGAGAQTNNEKST